MADFEPPRQPHVGTPLDADFLNSYYNSIMSLSKSVPDFWIDASNRGKDNDDSEDMGSARIRIVAGRYNVPNKLLKGNEEHTFEIPLPAGFSAPGKGTKDLYDPIIIVSVENKQGKRGDPCAIVLQAVGEDSFRVTVREAITPGTTAADKKLLNIDTINYIAIGFI